MRFLILDGDYPDFLRQLYEQNPALKELSYEDQTRFLDNCHFEEAPFFTANLRLLGHEAHVIRLNNEVLQRTWATEHGVAVERFPKWKLRLRRGLVPWMYRIRNQWMNEILAAQIKHYKPDVLVNVVMQATPNRFLREMKSHIGLLIGWASPQALRRELDPEGYLKAYDLVISPSEGIVDYFRAHGLRAELVRHGFEPAVLSEMDLPPQRNFPVTFVGLVGGAHYVERLQSLETLCNGLGKEMHIWGTSLDTVPIDSSIRNCYLGSAWGKEMYRVLAASKIVWNSHSPLAGDYADNYRMFEATGMSACLMTDWKCNLNKMFDVGKEILAYRTNEECVEMIRYYLDHDAEREAIAEAGHKRTLRDHTFWHRMQELDEIARRYIPLNNRSI